MSIPEVIVPVDQYQIANLDLILVARLDSTFALCLFDEVHETGALLHMQLGRPGRAIDPELTDNTLATDLLLLDQCLRDLKRSEPLAKHWQAKFIAHTAPGAGGLDRANAIQCFVEAYLADVQIPLAGRTTHSDAPQQLRFRPALAQIVCQSR
jgi:chemotaxis receptor (MCP) glutamine deamidase CheD